MSNTQLLIMVIPILLLQLVLIVISLYHLFKKGCKNLNKPVWLLIILFVNTIGPILFLLIGRKQNDYDNEFE